jgi:hypothetical protein
VTRYERGWRDAIEAAAAALNTANVSGPADAKTHWSNAGDALLYMLKRGELAPPKPEPR